MTDPNQFFLIGMDGRRLRALPLARTHTLPRYRSTYLFTTMPNDTFLIDGRTGALHTCVFHHFSNLRNASQTNPNERTIGALLTFVFHAPTFPICEIHPKRIPNEP